MTNTLATYQALLTGEYQNQPNAAATVKLSVQWSVDQQALLSNLQTVAFDLTTAVGVQLDAVGVRVGRSRQIEEPLSNVYFSWDSSALGWDVGNWQGPYDPSSGIVSLDDTSYRQLLSLVIAANNWDGTAAGANAAINAIYNPLSTTRIFLQDNLDMTATFVISGTYPSAILQALFAGGYIPFVASGVLTNYTITSVNGGPSFGFDTETDRISGWDVGAWAISI